MARSGRKWGMNMFMGEYHHNLDEKSRIVIPSQFRSELGNKFIIVRGIEKCLYGYSEVEWKKIVEKLQTLSFTKADARNFARTFFSGATVCELDKSGRVVLSSNLLNHANLNKECVIIGANDRFEIWDSNSWENLLKENDSKLSDIAENLFTGVDL